ncbi:MAG TPA: FUSC family protein [Bacillales bacterium]|nr:FUSC family protein [Bacillales bacterium]
MLDSIGYVPYDKNMKTSKANFQIVRHWRDRILVSDPGFSRLRQASQVTLTVISAVLSMYVLVNLFGNGQIIASILAGVLGLIGTLIVNFSDDSTNQKKITTGLLGASSVAAITLGAVLSLLGHVVDFALVAIIFIAFYLQRFGPRYFGIGMVAFITVYISSLLNVGFSQLPWLYGSIAMGVAYAFLFNFYIFRDQPGRVLKRSMKAFHIQTGVTLDLVIAIINRSNSLGRGFKGLERDITKLNEYAMMVSGQLASTDPSDVWPGVRKDQLRLYLFDTEMLIETLATVVKRLEKLDVLRQSDVRELLLRVVWSLREVLQNEYDPSHLQQAQDQLRKLRKEVHRLESDHDDVEEWLYLLRRIESIVTHVVNGMKELQQARRINPDGQESDETNSDTEEQNDEKEEEGEDEEGGLQPTTKGAIQAVIAASVCVVLGYILSPAHQYWTVLSAFVVLLGTGSVGRTLVKALQRVAGTLFGAIAGFGLAVYVSGPAYEETILVFLCVFMAFYFLSVSYALMVFWITMLLSLMYDLLLGGISEQLLQARVVDTLVGAAVGWIVSAFVFPKRTRDEVGDTMVEFLSELKQYVNRYLDEFVQDGVTRNMTDTLFDLDQKLQEARDSGKTLRRQPGSLARTGIERRLTALNAMNYYAKHLIASTSRESRLEVDQAVRDTLKHIETSLTDNIEALCKLMKDESASVWDLEKEREIIERSPDDSLSPSLRQERFIHDLYYVWRINQALVHLAKDLGAEVKSESEKNAQIS